MKIHLTETQKFYLKQQHNVERDSRVSDRIKTVLLADKGGCTQKRIAEALLIYETIVWGHLNDYLREQNLNPEGGGSSSKLDETQTQELIMHLERNTYTSTKEIIADIELVYGVSYTQQGMYDWRINHKFSHKKPKGTPAKYDEKKQEAFIKKYEELKSNLKSGEIIVFMDSVHPTSSVKMLLSSLRDLLPHPKLIIYVLLPAYSTNLNSIERLWKVTNEQVRNNIIFKTCAEFKTKIYEFYNSTWDTISSGFGDRIDDNFQRLKPDF